MNDAFICEKCGEEISTLSSYRLNDKLYCSSCLPIVHCCRCGVNTYNHSAKGPDGLAYCSVCLNSLLSEINWQVLNALNDRIKQVEMPARASASAETSTTPSYRLRLKLPFVTLTATRLDPDAERRVQEETRLYNTQMVEGITGFIQLLLEATGIKRQAKCDGDHAAPPCADPQCWRKPPPGCSCYEADPECPRHGKTEP